jgi:hypothetical protein
MADVVRYGEARAGAAEHLSRLMPRMVVQAALALPYAVRNLDAAAAASMRADILAAERAIQLAQLADDVKTTWREALSACLEATQTARLVAGACALMLYEAQSLSPGQASTLLARMLSPGTPVADAAGFFEGFFDGAGQRLIHDAPLRAAVDEWLVSLEADDFTSCVPLFRRVFSALDKSERRRMIDALFGRARSGSQGYRLAEQADMLWPAHFDRIVALLDARAPR